MTLTQSRALLLTHPSRPEGNQTMGPCVRRQPQLDLIPFQSPTWLQPHASTADSVGLSLASATTTTSWTHSLLLLAQGQTRRSLSGVWACAFNTTPYIYIRPSIKKTVGSGRCAPDWLSSERETLRAVHEACACAHQPWLGFPKSLLGPRCLGIGIPHDGISAKRKEADSHNAKLIILMSFRISLTSCKGLLVLQSAPPSSFSLVGRKCRRSRSLRASVSL